MAKRKCKPVEEWVQLHLFPGAAEEIAWLESIKAIRMLPSFTNWKPADMPYLPDDFGVEHQ
jgi:hypothetical protein